MNHSNNNPRATHCINGHEYTPENTRVKKDYRNGRKHRHCRQCKKLYTEVYKSSGKMALAMAALKQRKALAHA